MIDKRYLAGFIDFCITAIIQFFLMTFLVILPMNNQKLVNEIDIVINSLIITLISLIYMIIRDLIGTESIGKKIFKLKIINKDTKETATIFQRFIRNVTWLLCPIEILYFISKSGKKRIGDIISKTEIVLK